MTELEPHWAAVFFAYGTAILLPAILTAVSLQQSRLVRQHLLRLEPDRIDS
ncbi:MAG: hypothetical protein OXF74_00650 [Rhodobacteraceae bacterium]|nr:hypothetical protein [Paracoccaceae bacterium]